MFRNFYGAIKSIKRIENEFNKLITNYNSGKSKQRFQGFPKSSFIMPKVNIIETENHVVLTIHMPSQTKKSIKIAVDPEFLEVLGTKCTKMPYKEYYSFIPLPHKVFMKSIKKSYKNGILTIEFEKYKRPELDAGLV